VQVASGWDHMVSTDAGGAVWVWGRGSLGQLGAYRHVNDVCATHVASCCLTQGCVGVFGGHTDGRIVPRART